MSIAGVKNEKKKQKTKEFHTFLTCTMRRKMGKWRSR
jgi:hypothetical protein